MVSQVQEVYGVSTQYTSLLLEHRLENALENLLAYFSVKSRDGVIHEHDVSIGVNCSSQSDTSLLPS